MSYHISDIDLIDALLHNNGTDIPREVSNGCVMRYIRDKEAELNILTSLVARLTEPLSDVALAQIVIEVGAAELDPVSNQALSAVIKHITGGNDGSPTH